MPSSEDLEQRRRSQILDAAEKIFALRGFHGARMDDIASESGLSKGALYWYYRSKEELIHALLQRIFAMPMRTAEHLLEGEGSAAERIQSIMQASVQEIRRFEHILPLGYEFFALAARDQAVRRVLLAYYRRYQQILTDLLRQGIQAGEFKPLEPEEFALAAIGLIEGIALFWIIDPSGVDWDRMEHAAWNLFYEGVRRREG